MKNIILISLFMVLNILSYSQYYFPDSNAIWNVNPVSSDGYATGEILYGLKGDTVISDTLYKKLYLLTDTTLEDESLGEYLGGFRIEEQKVWFKPTYWNYSNILLYDFSKNIGDTIWHKAMLTFNSHMEHHFGQALFYYSVIINIISESEYQIYLLDNPRLHLDQWMIGIGSVYGLFGSIVEFPLVGTSFNLACLKHNDTVKYCTYMLCEKCFCIDPHASNEEAIIRDITVYPNPADHSLSISIDKSYSVIQVELIDEKGVVLYKKNYLEDPIYFNSPVKGIYFLKITIDKRQYIKKIVIE